MEVLPLVQYVYSVNDKPKKHMDRGYSNSSYHFNFKVCQRCKLATSTRLDTRIGCICHLIELEGHTLR